MNLKIVETGDGLHSLYVPELDEHYHSTHGALQEAKHVFIEAGLLFKAQETNNISILEIGFGTGLNAYLTMLKARKQGLKVTYHGLELYPVPSSVAELLNYAETIGEEASKKEFVSLHLGEWLSPVVIGDFELLRIQTSVFEYQPILKYDLIYFDAFGYRAQEEMWSLGVFQLMFNALKPGGVLVTYSSKGEVRRRMKESGFDVTKLPGPAYKREMVRAVKPLEL